MLYKVVQGKSHSGKFNGCIGTAIKVTKTQVVLEFEGIPQNNTKRGGYWFIKKNVMQVVDD